MAFPEMAVSVWLAGTLLFLLTAAAGDDRTFTVEVNPPAEISTAGVAGRTPGGTEQPREVTTLPEVTVSPEAVTTERSMLIMTTTSEPATTSSAPMTTTTAAPACPRDPYCEGDNLPEVFTVEGRKVSCDQSLTPVENCCLPQGQHYVCYNIFVDGKFLNFATDDPPMSTDYTQLCQILLRTQNATLGSYSAISTVPGGSDLAYRYGEWADVTPARGRIKDLACMIKVKPRAPKDTSQNEKEKKEEEDRKNDTDRGKEGYKGDAGNDTINKIDVN